MSEKQIENAILDYLNLIGFFAFKVKDQAQFINGSYRKPGRHCVRGVSDIIAVKNGKVLFIEVKTDTGRQSEHQKEFERCIQNTGGGYYVVRSLGECEILIESLDLARHQRITKLEQNQGYIY
jgi:hypothetical protein